MSLSPHLQEKHCRPCEAGTPPLSRTDSEKHLRELPGWALEENGKKIGKTYGMKNFRAAVQFLNRIAETAEAEGHHPDLHLTNYRKLRVELSTHAIGGLSENDFILAAKIEKLPKELK